MSPNYGIKSVKSTDGNVQRNDSSSMPDSGALWSTLSRCVPIFDLKWEWDSAVGTSPSHEYTDILNRYRLPLLFAGPAEVVLFRTVSWHSLIYETDENRLPVSLTLDPNRNYTFEYLMEGG